VGVGVPEALGAINRAAQAILGVRAQGTNHGEIPGRFLLRERKTREEEGEADVWVRERGERSGARAGERVGRAGPSVRGRVLSAEGAWERAALEWTRRGREGKWGPGPRWADRGRESGPGRMSGWAGTGKVKRGVGRAGFGLLGCLVGLGWVLVFFFSISKSISYFYSSSNKSI